MKKLGTAFVLLCTTVRLAGSTSSLDLPVPNGSFEMYHDSSGYPFPDYWVGVPPYIQSVAFANAPDGARVLRIDTTNGYAYAWGPSGANGMPHQVKPNTTYTLKVRVAKVSGYANTGGYLRLMVAPVKGVFNSVGASVDTDIPQQTTDGVWTECSAVFDSSSYPQLVGHYFLATCFAWGSAGHGQYGGGGPPCQLYFDHLTLEGSAPGIGGTVTLGDWSPADTDKRLTPVKVELIPRGSGTAKTEVAVTDGNGRYSILCDPGTYDVAFTAAGWLKKLVPGVVVGLIGQTACNVALVRGDVSGNNHIGTSDFSILSGNFGRAGHGYSAIVERGKQWVRSHPFTVSALVAEHNIMSKWDLQLYKSCNFTASLPWNFDGSIPSYGGSLTADEAQFIADMDANGMPWHIRMNKTSPPPFPNNLLTAPDKDNGWYITDEPYEQDLPGIGQIAAWLREKRPNSLVYVNICCRADDYVDNVLNTVRPDVLSVDDYLFTTSGEYPGYFSRMMGWRSKCIQYNVPMFSFIQAFSMATDPYWRLPSESELRMNVFSYLSAGVKGIHYFLYDHVYPDTMFPKTIMNADGTPSAFYYYVQDVNGEVNSLGRVLRYLESTDVRFIPGAGHSPPSGLVNWTAGAGGDSRITAVSVNSTGTNKDGLIGFFADDTGQRYFMLANLYRGPSLSASAASLGFTITFDSSANGLWRLNRETGAQEWVALTNHSLNTTLPGGTGDLYTYSPAGFDVSPPQGSVSINSGAASTTSQLVSLTLSATDDRGVTHMRFSNDNLAWSDWEPYASSKQWTLPPGEGGKTVYAQYRDAVGTISTTCSDSIALSGE